MDVPSPSQTSENVPQIFCNADGSQWHIFVEAGGITGRPKLIRTLKKAGAIVCSDPKQAQVILVDSNSHQGKLFIRDWGKDANRVVLEHTWVKTSIAVGKVLDQEDQWGGCLTIDDGLPITKEETDDTLNPLPTPRITPVEVAISERKSSALPALTPINPPPVSPQSTQQPVQNGSQYPPDANVPPSNQQPHLPPHLGYSNQSPAAMPSFSQFQHPNLMPGFPFQPGSNMNWQYYMLPGMMPYGPAGQNFGPSFPIQQMMNSMHPAQYPQDPHSLPQNANMNYSSELSYMSSNLGSTDSPISPSGIPPSLRRKSPVVSRSTPSSNGKMRSASPANYFSSISTPVSSQPRTQPTLGPPPSPLSTLFTSKKGQQLSFFVQVDLSNRSKVVTSIKRNGGKITPSHTTADYAILYSRSKTFDHLLESTLAAGRPAVNASFVHDSAEQNKILDTSPYEFEAPKPSPRGKRKRETYDGEPPDDKAEKKRLEKNRRESERRQRLRIKEESSPVKKSNTAPKDASRPRSQVTTKDSRALSPTSSDDPSRPRSPTPPPEHTRVHWGVGRGFMFSDHERDYVRRYVRILLERDHRMSMTAIAHHLYKKMDNHSVGSWKNYLGGQNFAAEFETMRKRASIAYRKTQSIREASQSKEAGPSRSARVGPSPTPGAPTVDEDARQQEILNKEIEFVAQFFARGKENPDDDEGNDDEIWACLTQQAKCQTDNSWEDFYGEHHQEVEKRYIQLTNNPAEATLS